MFRSCNQGMRHSLRNFLVIIGQIILIVCWKHMPAFASDIAHEKEQSKKESSAELIKVFFNHPFYWRMHAHNSLQDGFEVTADTETLYKLLTRKDAGTTLLAKYHKIESDFKTGFKGKANDPDYFLALHEKSCEMEMLLAQYTVIDKLTKNQRRALLKDALAKFQTTEHDKTSRMIFTALLLGRILQQESYPPFMRTLERPPVKYFIEKAPLPLIATPIFNEILTQAQHFLSTQP